MSTKNFLKSIKKHRESKKREKFKGFLEDYLELIEGDKDIAALAHKRLYKEILSRGLSTLGESDERCNKLFDGDSVKIYDYFFQSVLRNGTTT